MIWYFNDDLEGWTPTGGAAWTNETGLSAFGAVKKNFPGGADEIIISRSDLGQAVEVGDVIRLWYRVTTVDPEAGRSVTVYMNTDPDLGSASEEYDINVENSGWRELSALITSAGTVTGLDIGTQAVSGGSDYIYIDNVFIGDSFGLRHSAGGLPGSII